MTVISQSSHVVFEYGFTNCPNYNDINVEVIINTCICIEMMYNSVENN